MTTPDLERRLTSLLQDHAEGAMNDTNTQEKLTSLLADRERHLQTRRRGAAAGLAAVAAAVAVAVALAVGTWRGDSERTDPATAPDADQASLASTFLEAAYSFDLDRAEAMLAPDVTFIGDAAVFGTGTVADWRAGLAWTEASGFSLVDHECQTTSTSTTATEVHCTFAAHGLGSEQLGRGPFGGDTLDVTIVDGKITTVEEHRSFMTNGYNDEMWQPFKTWVLQEHPRDARVMYADANHNMPRTDPRSLELWEERVAEWVASQP